MSGNGGVGSRLGTQVDPVSLSIVQSRVRRIAWRLMRLLPPSLVRELRRRRYLSALKHNSAAEPELAIVSALVDRGDSCLDIGANFGLYTAALSRLVGAQGHVISIEPMPETYGLLTQNLRQLGMSNAEAIQCAVSDRDGDVVMALPQWSFGAPNFYAARITDTGEGVRVPCRRLDSIVPANRTALTFVKCDVEGHEASVLRGAAKVLEQGAAWLIELSGDPDDATSSACEVVGVMRNSGYSTYTLADGKVGPRMPGDHYINYFFLQPGQIQRLHTAGLTRGVEAGA